MTSYDVSLPWYILTNEIYHLQNWLCCLKHISMLQCLGLACLIVMVITHTNLGFSLCLMKLRFNSHQWSMRKI